MKKLGCLVLCSLFTISLGWTQSDNAETKPAEKQEEVKKDPKVEDYEKAIKDLTRIEGPFVLYQRKKDILLELPEKDLGKLFLMQATLNSGIGAMAQAGDPLGYFAIDSFRWARRDDFVWIVRPNFKFRWLEDDPLAIASKRSFPEAILGGYRIEQTNPEKQLLLVNVTALFQGDLFQVGDIVNIAGGGNYSLDRDKSGVESIRAFGDNLIVQVFSHYQLQRGPAAPMPSFLLDLGENFLADRRSAPLRITYNLWYRRPSDYRPRLADPRVGYFTEDYFAVDRFLDVDRTRRYVMRYDLRKKDPSAPLSEPIKPIVWYLDTSIPEKYKDAVARGILSWNKAFEAIGFKNAIVVKEAKKDDPDWDHADARHNVFRWTMSPNGGYAVALFRTDPYTGEVLNAAVTFDAGILAYAYQEQQFLVQPASSWLRFANPVADGPKRVQDLSWPNRLTADDRSNLRALGWKSPCCDYAKHVANDFHLAAEAVRLVGAPNLTREELAQQVIMNIASHEVGHCLGLRHNFVSSTFLSASQLGDPSIVTREGTTASVMDYVPANAIGILKKHRTLYSQTIGKYDMWAIRYGYEPIDAQSPIGERPRLSEIARQSGEPGHAFMTDEDADMYNPFVRRFDNASDPLSYTEAEIDVYKRAKKTIIRDWPRSGEGFGLKTRTLLSFMRRMLLAGLDASTYVGGVVDTRQFKGDVNFKPTLQPVAANDQRRAVALITNELLTMGIGDLPHDVIVNLSRDYNDESSSAWTAPLRTQIGTLQCILVASLLQANTVELIAENQFKSSGRDVYTMTEHYHRVVGNVFKEAMLGQNASDLRRDVQQFTLQYLLRQAKSSSLQSDAKLMARHWLRRIHRTILANRKALLNETTKIHYEDMADSIQRFLNRQVVEG